METFVKFVNIHTCKETLEVFHELKKELGLLETPQEDFVDQLSSKLNRWKEKQLLQRLKKRHAPRDRNVRQNTQVRRFFSCTFYISLGS